MSFSIYLQTGINNKYGIKESGLKKITNFIINRYRHMNMRLGALYRSTRFIYGAVVETIDSIVIPYAHRKRPVTVEVPVSIDYKRPRE
jgi:hypothetical protein